jgi:hypothetical protein
MLLGKLLGFALLLYQPFICYAVYGVGSIESVNESSFDATKYGVPVADFAYVKGLKLMPGINVLLHSGETYVNNIFPMGRGSQYLGDKQCLEVCDLIAEVFDYRNASNALHIIHTNGEAILRYTDLLNLTKKQIFLDRERYMEAIRLYGIREYKNDRDFMEKARAFSNSFQNVSRDSLGYDLVSDIRVTVDMYERLNRVCSFISATDLIVATDGKTLVKNIVQTALQQNAVDLCRRYMIAVDDIYLSYFGAKFTLSDREKLEKDPLGNAQKVAISRAQFAHTEYELMFSITKGGKQSVPVISAVSYYDLCENCEKLWASKATTKEAIFVSIYEYVNSRKRSRLNPNKLLREIQVK